MFPAQQCFFFFLSLFVFVAGLAKEVGDFEKTGLRREELMQAQTAKQQHCSCAMKTLLLLTQAMSSHSATLCILLPVRRSQLLALG